MTPLFNIKQIKPSYLAIALIAMGFIALYYAMALWYHRYYLDDGFSLSYIYYYKNMGYEFDFLVGGGFGVLAYFGKTYAFLHGLWAQVFGWGKITHQMLSVMLAWTGLWVWSRSFIKLGASKEMALVFILVMLLADAFMIGAIRTRPEASLFLIGALAVYFAVNRWWFWATLTALVALENHPTGSMYCIFVAAIWLASEDLSKFSSYKKAVYKVAPAILYNAPISYFRNNRDICYD